MCAKPWCMGVQQHCLPWSSLHGEQKKSWKFLCSWSSFALFCSHFVVRFFYTFAYCNKKVHNSFVLCIRIGIQGRVHFFSHFASHWKMHVLRRRFLLQFNLCMRNNKMYLAWYNKKKVKINMVYKIISRMFSLLLIHIHRTSVCI